MGKAKKSGDVSNKPPKLRPALTPEGRENQMISAAMDLAERQLLEGTASSQVITHFLKLGTEKARLERVKLEHENKLLEAKTEAIKSGQKDGELYLKAINAFKLYSGNGDDNEDSDIF